LPHRDLGKHPFGELLGVLQLAAHELEGLAQAESAEAPKPHARGRRVGRSVQPFVCRLHRRAHALAVLGVMDARGRLNPEEEGCRRHGHGALRRV